MDEAALILMAKQGDLTAFNRLVLTYQDKAYSVALRILGDPDQAADATQNGFIAAYRHLKSYRGGSFQAWILRIVTNHCFDELRKQKRRKTVPLEPFVLDYQPPDMTEWLTDPQELPEQAMDRAELAQAIEQCIQSLPPEFRVVVVLVDVEGLNYGQAAKAIDRPVGTVKSRLARARVRVQECLQGFRELLPLQYRLDHEDETQKQPQ